MSCKERIRLLLVVISTFAALLAFPPAGFAASSSPELLAPGAGYASSEGSAEVQAVQRLLRRLGNAPGPIDGLYGPLTSAAVQRFQEAHALAADGVVGPLTRGRLAAERGRLRRARLERKSPARSQRAESVPEPAHPRPAGDQAQSAAPDSPSARTPWIAAVVGGLALVLLLVVLWRLVSHRRTRLPGRASPGPRLGLVCAALLATYAIGAATGAVFASHATPDRAAKPSTATAEPGPR